MADGSNFASLCSEGQNYAREIIVLSAKALTH